MNNTTPLFGESIRISESISSLARVFKTPTVFKAGEGVGTIKVHETISKLAFIYEKIRNTIDYRDEHLFRIYAILRILKRRIFFEEQRKNHGETLIKELIRGGYLDNNVLPETKISETDALIEKYLTLINLLPSKITDKEKHALIDWLMTLAAGEIEDNLVPQQRIQSLVYLMYSVMKERIVLLDEGIGENEKNLQIFIACQRALTKADPTALNYDIFRCYYPQWPGLASNNLIAEVAVNLPRIKIAVERQIDHPAGKRLFILCQKKAAPFLILEDIFSKNPDKSEEILASPELLEEYIRSVAGERYQKIRAVLKRSAWRSVIYIFITKMLFAFLLEIPYDYYVLKHLYWPALLINIFFPPMLMFAMVSSVRIPKEENTIELIRELMHLVYIAPGAKTQYNKIKIFSRRPTVLRIIFGIVTVALFIISFGAIVWLLSKLNFSVFSQIIFLLFLTAISFFAVQIRRSINQILTVEKKENIMTLAADLFGYPIVQTGHWLSMKFRSINLFGFIFDVFLETPIKSFISLSEEWTSYLKEKKEEMRNP